MSSKAIKKTFNELANETNANTERVDKKAAADKAIAEINKEHGRGAIIKLSSAPSQYPHIATGILSLDLALGIGGLPKGRIVEIYGQPGSSKTSLTLQAIAKSQKQEGICAFIDVEHALDPTFAKKLGVDVGELLVSQPDCAEDALSIAEELIKSNALDIIAVDSVAALVPRAEIEGDFGDAHMGLQARLMSQAMRKLTGLLAKSSTILIFINQIRETMNPYGPKSVTSGGNALKFYASVRLEMKRIKTLTKGEEAYGNETRIKVVKNKMAPPFMQVEVDFLFDSGFAKVSDLLNLGVDAKVVTKSGSWYSYNETKLGQGKESVTAYLTDNPEILQEIEQKVKAHFNI